MPLFAINCNQRLYIKSVMSFKQYKVGGKIYTGSGKTNVFDACICQ